MGKRGKWDDVFWETDGETVSVEDTQEIRRENGEEPTLYEAPGEKRYFALFGLGLMRLSSAAHSVGTALIWHANYYSGRCDPSLGTLAHETGWSRRTVIRAVKELERKGVLRLQRRGKDGRQISNAHHLNWNKLTRKFCRFEQLVKERSAARHKDVTEGGSDKTRQKVVTERVGGSDEPGTQTNEGTNEGNQCPKRAHPPSAADARVTTSNEGKKEEGTQREPFTDAPTILDGRSEFAAGWWAKQEGRKLKALKTENRPEKRKELEAGLARAREHLRRAKP
jgi:DNA-binding transcriptional regulator YhcF (GntR family)